MNKLLLFTIKSITVLFFLSFSFSSLLAQKKGLFSIGTYVGVNFSQMDGDRHQGYDKIGLTAGVTGVINVAKRYTIGIDLGYSELGAKAGKIIGSQISEGLHPFDLKLNYAEVGLLNNLFFIKKEMEGKGRRKRYYYRLKASVGISYNRLLGAEVEERFFVRSGGGRAPIVYEETVDEFNSNNLVFVAGGTYFLKKNVGLELRYGLSINNLYETEGRRFLIYYVSLRGVYFF